MPDRWAVANGNWSSTATWNSGGSLGIPTGSDDVFSNNFTVVVDQSFSVLSLRSAASASAIVAGGSFNFNSGSISGSCTRTIANTSLVPGATNLIQITATTGTVTLTLGSDIIPRSTNNDVLILHSGNCNFTLLGGINLNGATGASSATCINKTSAGNITITGNLIGGLTGANNNAFSSNNGNTIVTGNVIGGQTGAGGISRGVNQSAGTLTVTGNVTGGTSFSTNQGIAFSGTSLTVNGTITGGTVAAAIDTSAATNIITGSVVGAATAGISYATAGLLSISGSCTAGSISPAVVSTNASATNIFTGPFINTNNTMAVQCVNMLLTQDASTSWNFGNATLFSPERLAFYPSASDIRQGVTYADGTVSGSLAMPPPTAVIAGTPTDNTTGSAVLTATQLQNAFWGAPLSQMTNTGSIGARLAKSATLDSTGNQLASYLI